MPRDLQRALDAAQRSLPDAMPPGADARVQARLNDRRPAPRRWGLVAAAAVACAALAAFVVTRQPEEVDLDGFALVTRSADCGVGLEEGAITTRGATAVFIDRVGRAHLVSSGPAQFARVTGGVRIVSGTVSLTVAPRVAGEEHAQYFVSGGVIEVLGTGFEIHQGDGRGSVRLDHGRIQFTATDGRVVVMAPGETLEWPLAAPQPVVEEPPEPEPAPAPQPVLHVAPKPRPAPPATPLTVAKDPDQLRNWIDEVEQLRARGRFADAAARLEEALATPMTASTRERLGYELGSIYTRQLADPVRACAQWARQQSSFPNGRYEADVVRLMSELQCSTRN
jgi:transmembrane sensor